MKSVVLCGSRKFKPQIRKFTEELKEKGVVVFEPFLRPGDEDSSWNSLDEYDKRFVALGLTHDHFHKIKMADVVYIYNKDGYSGVSTTMEIAYAVACGKPIYAYSDKDEEYCRKVFFREIIKTPQELIKYLNSLLIFYYSDYCRDSSVSTFLGYWSFWFRALFYYFYQHVIPFNSFNSFCCKL